MGRLWSYDSNLSNCCSIWKIVKFGVVGRGDIPAISWSGRVTVRWCRFRTGLASACSFTSLDTSVLFLQLSGVLLPLCIVPSCPQFQTYHNHFPKTKIIITIIINRLGQRLGQWYLNFVWDWNFKAFEFLINPKF